MSDISINLQSKITWCDATIERGNQSLKSEEPLNEKIKLIAKAVFAVIAKAFLRVIASFFKPKSEPTMQEIEEQDESFVDLEPYYDSEEVAEESREEIPNPVIKMGMNAANIVSAQKKRSDRLQILSLLTPIETHVINPVNDVVTHQVAMPLLRAGTVKFVEVVQTYGKVDLADPLSTKHFISVLQFTEKHTSSLNYRTAKAIAKFVQTALILIETPRQLTGAGNQMAKDHVITPLLNHCGSYLGGFADPILNIGKQVAESQVDKLHDRVNGKIEDLEKPYRKKIVAATVDCVAQNAVSFISGSVVAYGAYKLTEIAITPILGSVASETITSYAPWISTAVGIASIGVWVHSLKPVADTINDLSDGLEAIQQQFG